MGTVDILNIFHLFLQDQVFYRGSLHNATFCSGKSRKIAKKIAIMKELTKKLHNANMKIVVMKELLKRSIIQLFIESFERSQ